MPIELKLRTWKWYKLSKLRFTSTSIHLEPTGKENQQSITCPPVRLTWSLGTQTRHKYKVRTNLYTKEWEATFEFIMVSSSQIFCQQAISESPPILTGRGKKVKNQRWKFTTKQNKKKLKKLINISINHNQILHTLCLYGGSSHPKYSRKIRSSRT